MTADNTPTIPAKAGTQPAAAKVWTVSPSAGLRQVSKAEAATILKEPGARLATPRDIKLGA